MLNTLRDNFKNRPYLKSVLIAVAASLTLYLGAYFFDRDARSAGEQWAARVNARDIPASMFFERARLQDNQYSQLYGEQYDQLRPQLMLQVLQGLATEEIMLQEAAKAGIAATKEEIAEAILSDPTLKDENGNFIGTETYERVANRYWGGVVAYEDSQRRRIVLQKWQDMITAPVSVSPGEVEEEFRFRNEKTSVRYLVFAAADQQVDEAIADADIEAWYEAHPDDYRQEAGREVHAVLVDRKTIADGLAVDDAQVEAHYREQEAKYRHPEQRRASHILFKVPPGADASAKGAVRARAEEALARAQAGEDFGLLASRLSEDEFSKGQGGDLDYFARGVMVPAFEQAAFDTPVGRLAPVVETDFGFHVIQVTGEREAGLTPLDEVREEIRTELRTRLAQEAVAQKAQALANEADNAEQLAAAAEREGLSVDKRTLRRSDRLSEWGAGPGLSEAVFELEVGSVSDPIGVARGQVVVAVVSETEARIAPLEEVRNQVRVDVINDRLRAEALRLAREAAATGGALDRVARSAGLEVKESIDLIPGQPLPNTGGVTAELHAALFAPDAASGDRGAAAVPAGAVLYEITDRDPFDPVAFESGRASLREELLDRRRGEVLQELLRGIGDTYEVEFNPEIVAQLTASQG